jgi:glucokinase
MSLFAVGVDLGGTNLRFAVVDAEGKFLEKVTTGTRVAKGRDAVIGDMCAAIRELTGKFKSEGPLAGIGIGVPGIIDIETGMLRESPNLPGWDDYPVRDEIERQLSAPVILENDANAAALGEKWLGAARDYDDMCMITLGTGVGGGVVIGGRIWHGMTGMAGEVGHITVEPEGAQCNCGNRGCIEQYASAPAIVRMAREAISSGRAPQLQRAASSDREFSAHVVFNLAIEGDQAAQDIFKQVGRALGILMADLVNAFNFPIYVIGGGVSSGWEAFAPTMFDEVRRRSMVYAATAPAGQGVAQGASAKVNPAKGTKRKTIITRALLGSDAGLYGAARLPMLEAEISEHRAEMANKLA